MNLTELQEDTHPFYMEYMGRSMRGRYYLGVITPEWTATLNLNDGANPMKVVELFTEVVAEWDLVANPKPYDNGSRIAVGDVISYNGTAFRVHDYYDPEAEKAKAEEMAEEGTEPEVKPPPDGYTGETPKPEDLPEKGKSTWYGPMKVENVGASDDEYPVLLTKQQVAKVPLPMMGKALQAVMQAAQGNVDDAKKGG